MTLVLVILTALISIYGFNNSEFKMKTLFYPYEIKRSNDWYRFLTSGFLHADWIHLIINMFVLYQFGKIVELYFKLYFGDYSNILFLALYLSAIAVSSISTYIKHKDNSYYTSLGASGAVSAVVFAFILFNPLGKMGLIFIPVQIPGIIMGIGYLVYSYVMSNRGRDNINHEAHFYGAVYGIAFTGVLEPALFSHFFNQLIVYL